MTRIVLVEDDEPLRSALTEYLEAKGLLVTALPHAESALEAVTRVRPDVVVTDYQLPGMNGLELTAVLHGRGVPAPVILISGALPDRGAPVGGPGEPVMQLKKPFAGSVLLQAIEAALGR